MKENTSSKASRPLIRMDSYTHISDGHAIFQNVSFSLLPGECHSLIGIQSYGLYEFAQLFYTPAKNYTGIFELFGTPMNRIHKLSWQDIMTVSKGEDSVPFFSVLENIFLHRRHFLEAPATRETQLKKTLEELSLSLDLKEPVRNMTLAERKLLDVLRICVSLPKVAIFYDTISYLNYDAASRFPAIVNWLKRNGTSVIYISESLENALLMSDRISVFDNNSIRKTFDIEEVKSNPSTIIQDFSDLKMLYATPETLSEIPAVVRHLLDAREVSISELALNNRIHILASDIDRAFESGGVIIYFIDPAQNALLETVFSHENTLNCSILSEEKLFELSADNSFQKFDFPTEESKEGFFKQDNIIEHMFVYSFSISDTMRSLVQVIYHKLPYSDKDCEKYLKLFAKEISIAIDNSRLLGRSVLLQESHHRIKNNLQIVSNLLYLQKSVNPEAADVFSAAIKRINTIASIHNLLCHDESGNNIVNLRDIFTEIVKLYRTANLDIEIDMPAISIPYDKATSVALLVNELISNSIKHAFPDGSAPPHKVGVQCRNDGSIVEIHYFDNGVGLSDGNGTEPPAAAGEAAASPSGIGLSIIDSIADSLDADTRTWSDNGYHFLMEIPRSRIMAVNPVEQRL